MTLNREGFSLPFKEILPLRCSRKTRVVLILTKDYHEFSKGKATHVRDYYMNNIIGMLFYREFSSHAVKILIYQRFSIEL